MTRFPVTDQRMADVLRGDHIDLLRPFVGRENTVGAAAEQMHVSLRRMFYWVERFVEVGLLRVTREEPRQGRALKYYEAVAASFEIAPELVPPSLLDVAWRKEAEAAARAMREEFPFDGEDTVVQVEFSADDVTLRNYVPRRFLRATENTDQEPSGWWSSSERWLSHADAVAYRAALNAVYAEFAAKAATPHTPGTQPYRTLIMLVHDAGEDA